jgi:hypothetical protein
VEPCQTYRKAEVVGAHHHLVYNHNRHNAEQVCQACSNSTQQQATRRMCNMQWDSCAVCMVTVPEDLSCQLSQGPGWSDVQWDSRVQSVTCLMP